MALRIMQKWRDFLFKEQHLNYEISNNFKFIKFICPEDSNFSFNAHKEDLGESQTIFWEAVERNNKAVYFSGKMHRGFTSGIGTLEGEVRTMDPPYIMGITVKDRKAINIVPYKEILGLK